MCVCNGGSRFIWTRMATDILTNYRNKIEPWGELWGGGGRCETSSTPVRSTTEADPGFLDEDTNPRGGVNILFYQFSRKLYENEEILAWGGRVPGVPLDPPLRPSLS